MGRPVVAARTGGIPEVVLDNKTGLLFEKENPKALSEKILFLFRNPHKAVEMGKRAMEAALNFDIDIISRKYDSLYKKLFYREKIHPDRLI